LGDAPHERTQVVGINAGGLITGNEMREDEINLRIAGHRVAPADAASAAGRAAPRSPSSRASQTIAKRKSRHPEGSGQGELGEELRKV
jgi:hypothetical protein